MSSTHPTSSASPSSTVWNVPNQITIARLVLSIVIFVLIPLDYFAISLVLFIIAAGTDWLDGYWARKYNLVTQLGRILDPFCDKIIICGTFILLAVVMDDRAYGIHGWMAVIVVARELLVTALRAFIEQHGGDFSANMAGKLKMVFQCGAVITCLAALSMVEASVPLWLKGTVAAFVWLSLASTLYSGWIYIVAAIDSIQRIQGPSDS